MTIIAIGMLILVLAQTVTSYLRSTLLIYLRGKFDTKMMSGFFEHMLSLPFTFFQQRTSGDLLMRLASGPVIRETLTNQTLSIVLDGALIVVYLAVLLARAPLFGLLALGIGLVQVLITMSSTKKLHTLTQDYLMAQSATQSYLVQVLKGMATLKTAGAEDRAFDRWSNLFHAELNLSLTRSHISTIVGTAMTAVRIASPLILLWVGAQYVLAGSMSLGTMLAFNTLAALFIGPLTSLANNVQRILLVSAHFERIGDVIGSKPEQPLAEGERAPKLSGQVALNNVSFRYTIDSAEVLHNINVSIQPGQKVAIVGPTGAGKTTLGMLLLGLYPPSAGQITFDDIELTQMRLQSVRAQFGIVLQDPYLFSGSIRSNIALSHPNMPLDDVMEAGRSAAIHDAILSMPMGYETMLSEGGSNLSGGQRQRVALARAIAHKPSFLLLDEATSNLDVITESQIKRNLAELNCTQIIIAHRLSTIRNADLILVLKDGEIVAQGNHRQLVQQGGYYLDLIQNQSQGEEGVQYSVISNPLAVAESQKVRTQLACRNLSRLHC